MPPIGTVLWKDDGTPVVVVADDGEGSITVGHFSSVETVTTAPEESYPFSSSKPESADPNAGS